MGRRPSTTLLLILGLALLVRIGVIVGTPSFEPIFDPADFNRHAISIADGDGYPRSQLAEGPTAFRPPLYPLALAGVRVLGGALTGERLLGALLGVVTVLLVFEISRRLWGRRVAVVAGLIAAVYPPLIAPNASLLSEVLFIPLMLTAVLLMLEFRESRRLRFALLAGVACGLAALTRGNGQLLILAIAPGLWVLRPLFSRAALAAPALAVAAMLVTVAPWAIRNVVEFDQFIGLGTQGGYTLASTYSPEARRVAEHPGQPRPPDQVEAFEPIFKRPDLDEAERLALLNDEAWEYIGDHPGYVVETVAWNVPRMLYIARPNPFKLDYQALELQGVGLRRLASPVVLVGLYLVVALALVGVAAQTRLMGFRRAPLAVWAVPVLVMLPALAAYGLPRYRLPADPFLIMLAAVGLVAVFERVTRRRQARAAA